MTAQDRADHEKYGDYFHCEDCDMTVDFFKYESIEDTGHEGCCIRPLTPEETKEAVADCEENGCFEEA